MISSPSKSMEQLLVENEQEVQYFIEHGNEVDDVNPTDSDFNTLDKLINTYYTKYPWNYYVKYPEFCVKKLKLSQNLLNTLPCQNQRTRFHIKKWMLESNITLDNLIYVGW
tara:strand:+ start:1478 stop:1810 length:333 start_codon:yes stop_codon:yes gene_type:complete